MSASLLWTPTGKGRSLRASAPSMFITAMREAFGEAGNGWIVGERDLPTLRGMRAAGGHIRETMDDVIAAVEEHGEIRIWAEY